MHAPDDLVAKVLSLPDEARADLALRLLESLSPDPEGTDEEWLAEIERRADCVMAGGSVGVPEDEVYERALKKLRKP